MRTGRAYWLMAGAVVMGALMSTTTATAAGPELVTSVEGITEYKLNNGLRILLFPDQSKPQVTVNLTVLVGSRHEGYGEAGMAHLLEHMVFKGTPTFREVPKVLKEHGATFNGTTWLDRTNYYETMPASDANLEFGIQLEADRMINSFIKKEDLESEMTVVRNEFERGENSPERILSQRMMSTAFEWHNYGKSTIGNRADIERVPVDSLRRFYKKFYQPDNAILVIAGHFDPEKALGYAEKYFGAIPRPERVLENTYTEEPPQDGERSVFLRRIGDVALAGAIYHICSGPHPDYAAADVLQHILTAAPSGRLYKQLVETRMATRVDGSAYALHDPGVLTLMATVAKANEPQDVLSRLTEIVESIGEEGVTKEEVDRAVRFWMKTWELAMTDSSQTAIQISDWAAQGDWRLLFIYRDRLEKVTPEEVKAVAKKYLTRNNRTVGLFVPSEKSERISIPQTPALAEMIGDYKGRAAIAGGESFDVSPKNVEERTARGRLGSGLKTALLPKKTRGEMVQARLTIHYGALESLQGLNTAAEALPTLMLRGTRNLSRQQIQDLLDENKARLGASGSVGEASFTIEATRKTLPVVLDLLRQVLREPTLPVAELDTIRNLKLSGLAQQLTDPQAIAQTAVQKALSPYPPIDVRYAPSIAESIDRWKTLGRDDVVRLHRDFVSGEHGELSIVGDFDVESTQIELARIFDGWSAKQPYERIPRPGNMPIAGRTEKIETPDKDNAVYFAGEVIPMKDSDPDYPAFTIGNYVLGSSGLSSRLGDRVRQREGLSYGVGSMFRAAALDDRAIFSAYAITNPVNMPKVDTAIREETSKIISQGITGEELAAAQQSYLENQKVLRSDDSHLASMLNSTLENDRDMSFYAKLETHISQLTTEAVKTALQKRLSLDKLVVVMAGDFARAEKEAAAAKPAEK